MRLSDTVALRLHLLVCKACPQFEKQLVTLRLAMGRWPKDAGKAPSSGTQGLKPD